MIGAVNDRKTDLTAPPRTRGMARSIDVRIAALACSLSLGLTGSIAADRAKVLNIYEGTREMNSLIVGKAITGFSAFV